jgi:hypothetical protein
VPPAPSDRRLLVVTAAFVALAGVALAAVLFFATGGGGAAPKRAPVYIGLESELRSMVNTGGPLYFAHPFGGTGFWLALEDGHLVALVARRPGTQSCTAKWKLSRHAYVDCRGTPLTSRELERYPVQLPQGGAERGGLIVDFRHIDPAPTPVPA